MNPEDQIRNALQNRADEIEPSPASYATLAEKVLAAQQTPRPWWQLSQRMWLGALTATAAVLLFGGIFIANRGDDSQDNVFTSTPTPESDENAEDPTPEADDGADEGDEPSPTDPTPVPLVDGEPVLWPIGTPDDSWPTTAEGAVVAFYEQVLGVDDPPLAELTAANPGVQQFLVFTRGEDGDVFGGQNGDEVANAVVRPVGDDYFGLVHIDSADVIVEEVLATSLADLQVAGMAWAFEGTVDLTIIGEENELIARGFGTGGGVEMAPYTATVTEVLRPDHQGEALVVISTSRILETEVPGVGIARVTLTGPAPTTGDPTPTPAPEPSFELPNGAPSGVIWPVAAFQPFSEWPNTPEDAAFVFVDQMIEWPFEVGEVVYSGANNEFATVAIHGIDEDGQQTIPFMTVQLAGGVAFESLPNWGVTSATDSEIVIASSEFRSSAEGLIFVPTGQAVAFEGNVGVTVQDAQGSLLAQGNVQGGGVELLALSGFVSIGDSTEGPGFVVYSDIGGRGIPTSVTVEAVQLPQYDAETDAPGAQPGNCSASGMDVPGPQEGLPSEVEATRDAILSAAVACDYETLATLLGDGNFSFGGGSDPAQFWRDAEEQGLDQPMRYLVETLGLDYVHDTGTASATTFYTWPEVFVLDWSTVTAEQRAEIEAIYGPEGLETYDSFEGFIGYRLSIASDGEWLNFVAGD